VPAEAVARKKGRHTVSVEKAAGEVEERPVRVGITDGVRYEVLDGLAEGDRVEADAAAAGRWQKAAEERRPGPPMLFPGGGRRR